MVRIVRLYWLGLVAVAVVGQGCLSLDTNGIDIEPPPDSVSFTSVSAGAFHACGASTLGQVWCWGANGVGQLGLGDQVGRLEPWPVVQGTGLDLDAVSAGGTLTCAVTPTMSAYCWGANDRGQLGMGTTSFFESIPTQVSGGIQFTRVTAGGVHACALAGDNRAFCWGMSEFGKLGNGQSTPTVRPSPDSVRGGLTFNSLSAGQDHTCGVTVAGDAYCWGDGRRGQIGDGATTNRDVPAAVGGGLIFTEISAGGEHTCAISIDGQAYCWGNGEDGRLGDGGQLQSELPVLVSGGLFFESISAGAAHTCGVTDTQEVYCWGRNDAGQLGDGTTTDRAEPTAVLGGLTFQTVSAGIGTITATCGFSTNGLVYCWGDGAAGQLGNGTSQSSSFPSPVSFQKGL